MLLPDIIQAITEKHTLPKSIINEAVKLIFAEITQSLTHKGRVEIRDFGIFSLRLRSSRGSRNPKTGVTLVTPSKYVAHFKPGKNLRTSVNQTIMS